MSTLLCHVTQGSANASKVHLLLPLYGEEILEPTRYRTRGMGRSYGSGPFFAARADPSSVTTDKGTYDMSSVRCNWIGVRNFSIGVKRGMSLYLIQASSNYKRYTMTERANYSIVWDDDSNCRVTHVYSSYICPFATISDYVREPQSRDEAIRDGDIICNAILEFGTRNGGPSTQSSWVIRNGRKQSNVETYIGQVPGILRYTHSELTAFQTITELGIIPNPFDDGFSTAYVNACDNLSSSDVNSIANVGAAIDLGKSICAALKSGPIQAVAKYIHERSERGILRNSANSWLSYRYAYTTTKLDLREYQNMLKRFGDLARLAGKDIHSSGFYDSGDGQTYKAEIRLCADQLIPVDVADWLSAVGLAPTPENVWDMIPYSFIVDWFLHVSDFLNYFEGIGSTFDYDIKECWFTYMSQLSNQHVFFRVPGRKLESMPHYAVKEASGRTITMRFADTVSLVLGR